MIIEVTMSYPTQAYYPTIDKERDLAQHWILQLANPERREDALYELVKMRDYMTELAPMLWFSFGTTAVLVHELIDTYPVINPPALTPRQSNRICNALALFQCMAAHQVTRPPFMSAEIVMFMLPLLKSTMTTHPFEYLRLTTLGVIGALIKSDEDGILNYFLGTDIVPLCLKIIEIGLDLSKTVAIYIIQRLLTRDNGLTYMCENHDRLMHVCMVLGKMVLGLVKAPCTRTLKLVSLCYLRLSEDLRAREALRFCLPHQLRNSTFAEAHLEDPGIKHSVLQLIRNLSIGPFYTLPPAEQNSFDSSDYIMPSARKSKSTSNVQSEQNDSEKESNSSEETYEQQTSERTGYSSGRYPYDRPKSPTLPLNLQGVPSYEPPMNIMHPHVIPEMQVSPVQQNTLFSSTVPPPMPPGENIYTRDTIYPYPTFHLNGLSKYVLPPDIPQDTDCQTPSCAESSSQDKSETSPECLNFNLLLPSPSSDVTSQISSSPELKTNLSNPPLPLLYQPPPMLNHQFNSKGQQLQSPKMQTLNELHRPPIMSTRQQESRYQLSPRLDQPNELFPNHILHTTNISQVQRKFSGTEQSHLSVIPEDTSQIPKHSPLQQSHPVKLPSMQYPPPVIHGSLHRPPPPIQYSLLQHTQIPNSPVCLPHEQLQPLPQQLPRYHAPVQYTSSPDFRLHDSVHRSPSQQQSLIQQSNSQEQLLPRPPVPLQYSLLRHPSPQQHIMMRHPSPQQLSAMRNISPQQQAQMQQLPQPQIPPPQPQPTIRNVSPHLQSNIQNMAFQRNSIIRHTLPQEYIMTQNISPHHIPITQISSPRSSMRSMSQQEQTKNQAAAQQREAIRNVSLQEHTTAQISSPQQATPVSIYTSPRPTPEPNISPQKNSLTNHESPELHTTMQLPSPKYQQKEKSSTQNQTQISRPGMILNHLQSIPPQRLYPEHGPNAISCSQEQVSNQSPTTQNNQPKSVCSTPVTITNRPVTLNKSLIGPLVTPEVLPQPVEEKPKIVAKKSLANIVSEMSQLESTRLIGPLVTTEILPQPAEEKPKIVAKKSLANIVSEMSQLELKQMQSSNKIKKQGNQNDIQKSNKQVGKYDTTVNEIYRQTNGQLISKKAPLVPSQISPRQKMERQAQNQTLHTKYSQGRSQTNINSSRQWTNHTNSLTNNQGQNRGNNSRPQSGSNQNRQWTNQSLQGQNGRSSNRGQLNSGKGQLSQQNSNQRAGSKNCQAYLNNQKGVENGFQNHKNHRRGGQIDQAQNGLSNKSYKENIVTQVGQTNNSLEEQSSLNNLSDDGWQAVGRSGSTNQRRRGQGRSNKNSSLRSRPTMSRSQPCTNRTTR